jgi:hypothetical protein
MGSILLAKPIFESLSHVCLGRQTVSNRPSALPGHPVPPFKRKVEKRPVFNKFLVFVSKAILCLTVGLLAANRIESMLSKCGKVLLSNLSFAKKENLAISQFFESRIKVAFDKVLFLPQSAAIESIDA